MSFYGSIFYQATNAFAEILIKNSGIDKKDETTVSSEKVELSAGNRSSQLHLDTGNRWIQLKGDVDNNECKFYHNRPDLEANNYMFLINTKDMDPSSTTILDVSKGVQFTVPLLYYDDTGHLAYNREGGNLYHTFEIPKIEIQTTVDDLTERVESMEETSEQLELQMSELSLKVDGSVSTIDSISSRVGKNESDITEINDKLEELETELAETNSAAVANTGNIYRIETQVIAGLEERIKVLEDKLNAQLG